MRFIIKKIASSSQKFTNKEYLKFFSLSLLCIILFFTLIIVRERHQSISHASGSVAILYGKNGTFGGLANLSTLSTGQSFQAVGINNWGFSPGESEYFAALGSDGEILLATTPQTDNQVYTTANQMNVNIFNPATNLLNTLIIPTTTGSQSATNPFTNPPNIVGGADIGMLVPVNNKIIGISAFPYSQWNTNTYGLYPSFFSLMLSNNQWVYDPTNSYTSTQLYNQSTLGQLSCPMETFYTVPPVPLCGYAEMSSLAGSQYLVASNYFPDGAKNEHSGRITVLDTNGIIKDVYTYPDIQASNGATLQISPRSVIADPTIHRDPITNDQLAYFVVLFDANDTTKNAIATSPMQLFAYDITAGKIIVISSPVFTGQTDTNGNYLRMGLATFDGNGNLWVGQGVYNSLQAGPMVVYTKHSDGTLSLETTCKATSNWTTSPWNQTCPPDVTIAGSEKFGDAYSINEDPSNHMIYSVTLSGYLLGFTQTGSGSNFSATMLPQIDIGLGYLRANGSYIGIRRSVIDPNSRTLWIPIDQVYNPQTCPTWPGSTPCTPIVLDQWLYKFDLATLYSNLTPTPTPTFTPTPTATPAPTLTPTPNPPTATSSGLLGNYFSNRNLSGTPTFTRTDATVNFNWGTASPAPSLSNINYSIRWTGFVTPSYSQTYTFYTKTDDGTRLYVNNTLLINDWANQAATQKSGTISLLAGHTYPIKMEYYQHLGKASAQLSWSSASQLKQIIPQSQLYH